MWNRPIIEIIEDDSVSLTMLSEFLGEDCDVVIARSGNEGLARLTCQPDLVIVNLGLPDMSGIDFIRQVKADQNHGGIPIVIVTGSTDERSIGQSYAYGAVDFFTKPLSAPIIRARVKHILATTRILEEAHTEANTDPLTRLWNRRYFDRCLASEWKRHHRAKAKLGLALVDLDNFKAVNDKFGHAVGDNCLVLLGSVLERWSGHRAGDMCARIGGEEFAFLLPQTDLAGCYHVASMVREEVKRAFMSAPDVPELTASFGVHAMQPDAVGARDELFRLADEALYEAKNAGRNCVRPLAGAAVECQAVIDG